MPIYEYVCRQCGEELERLQKMSDAPLTDCPACGEAALRRKVSAAGFRLAGSGWYETDFKTEGRRNLAGDREGKQSNGDAKSDQAASASKTESAGKAQAGSKSNTQNKGSQASSAGAGNA
ncbi:MAG TPA: zinc ribbon domain-containing protein [Salinisphaeraceae bacterium]|nr:zinc ribbon domain-containing protein [Salinisphaeraceae bacterium]